ncbi:tyrosine-type recombinase/integrase [Treponema zuelzerae]|uniref:Tyrosine-type recombinase/integrase n=1 Tax=Teretinema zuelzerae TaxID=156 RepID=A0AAE3EIS8_9SPIR|nr:tyrosine-type recombinase/integrase [Teretinema zuelzerae]MCD1655494.1 tyrosine-type recombinase/integrase [Teretinema zuelzerae]
MWHTPFSLYRRRVSYSRKRSFYVQFWDPEKGSYRTGVSIRQIAVRMNLDPDEWDIASPAGARAVATEAIKRGLVATRGLGDRKAGDYLAEFWDWDTSPYIKGRLARKSDALGRTYCRTCKSWVVRYFNPSLGELKLSQITTGKLESWFMGLKDKSGLHPQTLNNILQSVSIGFKEAYRLGIIPRNPAASIRPLGAKTAEKGILDTKEVKALLALDWPDERGRLAFTLALMAGLRLGEIQALCKEDIMDDHLLISHSWDKMYGMKSPKGKRSRIVPVPESVLSELRDLAGRNPWLNGFVFWDEKTGERPLVTRRIENWYYAALERIGIPGDTGEKPSPKSRHGRALYFHGLRHLCNSLLRGVLPDDKLRAVIGHADISMTRHYDHLTDVDRKLVLEAQKERFLGLMPK